MRRGANRVEEGIAPFVSCGCGHPTLPVVQMGEGNVAVSQRGRNLQDQDVGVRDHAKLLALNRYSASAKMEL